jgi:hypothetical protein
MQSSYLVASQGWVLQLLLMRKMEFREWQVYCQGLQKVVVMW